MSVRGASTILPIPVRPTPSAESRVTDEEARAMLRAALTLFERWGLSRDEARTLLGNPSERTFGRWRAGDVAALPTDTVHRLGDILGIHKALRYMFTDVARAYAWMRRPNQDFAGRSALDLMLQGAPVDLARVRAFLDAERGAW